MHVRTWDIRWVFGLILLAFLLSKGGEVRGETIPLTEYRFRIQEAIDFLESKEGAMEKDGISFLEKKFPAGLTVRDMDDEPVKVDRKDLLHLFHEAEKSSEGREPVLVYLRALSEQLSRAGQGLPSGVKDWEDSRRVLDKVFLAKAFKHLEEEKEPPWVAFIEKIRRFLNRWLRDHLGAMEGSAGKWAEFILYGGVLALGIIVIVWIFRSSGPLGWRLKRLPKKAPAPPRKSFEKSWTDWREEALSKARKGEFRDAIRYLFISVLMEGHQKGWWVYEPASTNREHLARMEGPTERREMLQRLTDLYERAWYGLGQPGNEEFIKCETWSRRLGVTHE